MTKSDYMTILAQKLRRLPKEDYDTAIDYFEEYFADAGPENEQQAIQDLGAPQDAANELIINLALKTSQEPPRSVKRGLSALWIGILAVFAAPVALPLALAFLIILFCIVIVVLAMIFCLFLSAIAVAASGVIGFIGGAVLLFTTFSDGLTTIGLSLFALGAGLLFVYASAVFCRWFLKRISKSLGKITKGGKKYENNH